MTASALMAAPVGLKAMSSANARNSTTMAVSTTSMNRRSRLQTPAGCSGRGRALGLLLPFRAGEHHGVIRALGRSLRRHTSRGRSLVDDLT